MPEFERRTVLAGGAAGLAALSGCSSLPIVGERNPRLGFDPTTLSQSLVPDLPARPATYPAPVPDGMAARHRRRGRQLLDAVPADPSFPNEALSAELADRRADAVEEIENDAEGPTAFARLADWRYARSEAAAVRGAYEAATGDLDGAVLARRRRRVRERVAAFEAGWEYPGRDPLEALAVGNRLERLGTRCRRSLVPDRTVPDTGGALVVGDLAGDVERARAALADATRLAEAHRAVAGTTAYRDDLSVLARRVGSTREATSDRLDPYFGDDATPDTFDRTVEGLPAEELFNQAEHTVRRHREDARAAEDRGNHARATVASGRAITSLLALSTVVDAIQNGAYGMPETAERVRGHWDRAVSAIESARSTDPAGLAGLLAVPAWRCLLDTREVIEGLETGEVTADEGTVVRLTASFGLAEHLAEAVPEVTRRLSEDLPASATGS